MPDGDNFGLKVKNYKCFGDEPQGFDKIKQFNIIIGKNNSGKSALLDAVEYANVETSYGKAAIQAKWGSSGNNNSNPKLIIPATLDSAAIMNMQSNSHFPNSERILENYENKQILATIVDSKVSHVYEDMGQVRAGGIDLSDSLGNRLREHVYINSLCLHKIFRRLSAERDILPENQRSRAKTPPSFPINSSGSGATDLIQNYYKLGDFNHRELVVNLLLNELNKIFKQDSAEFKEILPQIPDSANMNVWEIYLKEDKKGNIPLSKSGSGLKTILLVLLALHLIPEDEKQPIDKYIFGFEELENNLHPSLQRRLFDYLIEFAKDKKCIFFITTHSPTVIDIFSHQENAQIVHVKHNGENAKVCTVGNGKESFELLDDIGARASDILQCNCIIWVEGPSDRIYIKKWIEIWTDGRLKEGLHYQCMFYGGSVLSHISVDSEGKAVEDLVDLLKLNRNSIVVMDSDKKNAEDSINANKQRIMDEVKASNIGLDWLTEGKEIENYVPVELIKNHLICKNKEVENLPTENKYVNWPKYLEEEYKIKLVKVKFARDVSEAFDKSNIEGQLDLAERIEKVCKYIRKCNGLEDDDKVKQPE